MQKSIVVGSALMIGTTTAPTGFSTPVMAQENTEISQVDWKGSDSYR